VRLKMKDRSRSSADARNIPDVLTDIRGLPGVVTVTQLDTVKSAEDSMSKVFIRLKFNDDGVITRDELQENMMEIPEVDMISIKAYDDVPVGSEPETEEADEAPPPEPPPSPKTRSVRRPTPALETPPEPTPAPVKKPKPAPKALSFFAPRPEEMKRGR
ncbi:MAG: hypothetical protein EBZ48_14360, partial [Proteobacteria bacterium]|nr:hypothetical protein [Pseudomonadota bacterium]